MIPHSRPSFSADFLASLQSTLHSGHTASGTQTRLLEEKLIQYLGCDDAVAVDSGTSALMLAIRALSSQQNIRRVGIPAYACSSLLFAVRSAGCTPVCMDCNQDLRLDVDKAWAIAPSLDAVILVHPFGMIEPLVKEAWPCPVIEDIAQAAGAILDKRPVGSFGDIAITSFYATKPWGGAYGGMVLASQELCAQVRAMSNPDTNNFNQAYVGHHQLSDIHASLVLSRLTHCQQELIKRQQRMQWIDTLLPKSYVQSIHKRESGSAFRYIIRITGDVDTTIQHLHAHGITASKPVQQALNLATNEICNGAYQAWQDCISMPLLATMNNDEEQQYTYGLKQCFPY